MKCLILAGGSGDALWPLSRKHYPKQFIRMNEGRSLFQEAIVRNLPFCDEFIIVTSKDYRYIVEGQLQAFQSLKYQLFLEEMGKQTAPAVAIVCMCLSATEEVLVVSTDHMIEGDYNTTILATKEKLAEANIVVVGCEPKQTGADALKGHSAFVYAGDTVTAFIPRLGDHKSNLLLDAGIFLMRAGTYLDAIRTYAPALYEQCSVGENRLMPADNALVISKQWMSQIPSLSVGEGVFAHLAGESLHIVKAGFAWSRLLSMESVVKHRQSVNKKKESTDVILNNCRGVDILQETDHHLVVGNDLEDLVIVHTQDATYISKKGESADIKDIMSAHYEAHKEVFDEGDIFYSQWGLKEILQHHDDYMVRRITIFPGKGLRMHKHAERSENWTVVSGTVTITMQQMAESTSDLPQPTDGPTASQDAAGYITRDYHPGDIIHVAPETYHKLENKGAKEAVLIEVTVGESAGQKVGDLQQAADSLVKLAPAYKDYIWGGTRLYTQFGKDNPENLHHSIAESWELSAHPAGPSLVIEGNAKGMPFDEYLEKAGKEVLGWKGQAFDRFPLLVKFIDANAALSVQVHPDDAYALREEGEYGKNEMWYILDAKPGACLYAGFSKDVTKEECLSHIEAGTLTKVLHQIPVQKGDVVFVEAGTVHAILEGILVLEIQQSSNATYRLYDYDRVDKNGKKRPLHIEKAMDNLKLTAGGCDVLPAGALEEGPGYTKQCLAECKYFSTIRYDVNKKAEVSLDEASFATIVFVAGEGTVTVEDGDAGHKNQGASKQSSHFVAGDTYFIPAGKKVLTVDGACEMILSHL